MRDFYFKYQIMNKNIRIILDLHEFYEFVFFFFLKLLQQLAVNFHLRHYTYY